MSPVIIRHQGFDNHGNTSPSGTSRTPSPTILFTANSEQRANAVRPYGGSASLLCRKIATLFADLHLIGERVAVQILSLRYYFVFVLYFGQLCSFLIPHSSLIPLFQIFYFFKMNIFSAARNNSNSRKRHILNRKDLCYEKNIRYAYLPQPLRYHARRLFKK